MYFAFEHKRKLISLFLGVLSFSFFAQQRPGVFYRLALARSNTYMVQASQGNGNKGIGATCVFAEAGLQVPIDSAVKVRFSARYGYERKRFEKEQAKEIYFFYHLINHSFSACTEVITPLTDVLDFTAGINLAYILASQKTGAGQRSSGYTFTYALEDNRNLWDLRPHLGLEYSLNKKQKAKVFFEAALSLLARKASLKDQLISANFPSKFYLINYSTIFFSAGLRF